MAHKTEDIRIPANAQAKRSLRNRKTFPYHFSFFFGFQQLSNQWYTAIPHQILTITGIKNGRIPAVSFKTCVQLKNNKPAMLFTP